jgi:hypothetical protein
MRVLIGSFATDHGTVETSPEGLVYSGPDPAHVRAIAESERSWYDRSGTLHNVTDEQLVRSLPYRLEGYFVWAVVIDKATGLTVGQPPYDPWGDVWFYGKAKADPEREPPVIAIPVEDAARASAQREWNQQAAAWAERAEARARRQRGPSSGKEDR